VLRRFRIEFEAPVVLGTRVDLEAYAAKECEHTLVMVMDEKEPKAGLKARRV